MTEIVIVATVVLLIGYDIYVAGDGISGNTITQSLQKWSKKYPVIPFAFGFLAGHLFGDF